MNELLRCNLKKRHYFQNPNKKLMKSTHIYHDRHELQNALDRVCLRSSCFKQNSAPTCFNKQHECWLRQQKSAVAESFVGDTFYFVIGYNIGIVLNKSMTWFYFVSFKVGNSAVTLFLHLPGSRLIISCKPAWNQLSCVLNDVYQIWN